MRPYGFFLWFPRLLTTHSSREMLGIIWMLLNITLSLTLTQIEWNSVTSVEMLIIPVNQQGDNIAPEFPISMKIITMVK